MTSAIDELLTEYAIDHIDWPDSEDGLDRFLEGKPMTSDIDKLLELLRHVRDFYAGKPSNNSLALEYARHIAAVEELVTQASLHAMANSVVVNERTEDGDPIDH